MPTPFGALFHTPNGHYFYDSNKNEFININRESVEYLSALFKDKRTDIPIPNEISELQRQGCISYQSNVKTVRHAYSDYLGFFLDRKLSKVTLQLTQNCNFRCKYCVYSGGEESKQRTHSTKKMSLETAKRAIDFLWEHSIDSPTVNVGFYGGEPLLEFSLIKQLVEYATKRFHGKELTFSITSNGTLLNEEIIKYFEAHNVSLMISLDGPKEINDANRVFADGRGTYDTVIDKIKFIQQIAPEYSKQLQISMVIDPQNDFDCINSICIDSNDVRQLNFMPSIVQHDHVGMETTFSQDYVWKYEYQRFLAFMSYFGRYNRDDVSPIANRALASAIKDFSQISQGSDLNAVDAPSGPCIPGQLRLFVNVDEQLFPCERVNEKTAAMQIGTLAKGIDPEKAERLLNVGRLTEQTCKNCWCFRHCTICAKKADDSSATLSASTKLLACNEVASSAYGKLRQWLLLNEAPTYYPEHIGNKASKELYYEN